MSGTSGTSGPTPSSSLRPRNYSSYDDEEHGNGNGGGDYSNINPRSLTNNNMNNSGRKMSLYGKMILGIACLAAMRVLVGSYSKFMAGREYKSHLKAEQQQHELELLQQQGHHTWADTVQDEDMASAPEGLNWDHDQSLNPRHYSHFGAAVPLGESSIKYKDTPLQDRMGSGNTYYSNGNHERAGFHAGHTNTYSHAGNTVSDTNTDTENTDSNPNATANVNADNSGIAGFIVSRAAAIRATLDLFLLKWQQ
jgi:hypothetical protein